MSEWLLIDGDANTSIDYWIAMVGTDVFKNMIKPLQILYRN